MVRDPELLHLGVDVSARTLLPLAGALLLALAVLRWPGLGLVLLLVATYLNLSQVLVRFHGMPSLLQLLAVPLLLAAWLDQPSGTARGMGRYAVPGLLAGYTLVLFLSTTYALDRSLADWHAVEGAKALFLVVLVVLLVNSRERLRLAVWAMVAAGALLAVPGLVQVATGEFANDFWGLARIKHAHIYGSVFEARIAGPLGDPNYFAQILLVLVPIALFLGWTERGARARVLAFGAAGLLVAATVFTYSRGGALALVLVVLLSLLVHRTSPRALAAGALVVAATVLLLPPEFTRRVTTLHEIIPGGAEVLQRDASFEERRLLTAVAWQMFRDRPVLGVGAGNYTTYFDDYAHRVGSEARDYAEAGSTRYPHNLYLEMGAETGVVGLGAFLAVILVSFGRLRRTRRAYLDGGDPGLAGIAAALQIALAGYLVSSLFLHGHFQRYLWLLFALAAAVDGVGAGGPSQPARRQPTAEATGGALVGGESAP